MATPPKVLTGLKRVAEEASDEPQSSGLTPFIGAMGVDSPRKTPKLTDATSPRANGGRKGQMPTPLTLPGNNSVTPAEQAEHEEEEEEDEEDCDGLGAMLAFHQRKNGAAPAKKPTPKCPQLQPLFGEKKPSEEEDGWDVVQKPPRRSKKLNGLTEERPGTPEDAYVDPEWSSDDGCNYESYDQAKSGSNSKGKHTLQFKATQARNMAIAKRDAQRGGPKR